jgi:cell division septal protein FtsQ
MRDFAAPKRQRKKVQINKVKVQRKPLDLKKYLRPLKVLLPMLPKLAGAIAIFALVVVGYRALGKLTFFKIKNIEVSESKRLSREEILAVAGVDKGGDLLRVNLKRVGEQLALNPWVETVRVRRYFPDSLSISITEREPLAVVNMGYIYYLDKKGKIFKVLNKGDRLDYPVITGFSEEDLKGDPEGTKKALESTCELLKNLQEKGAFILAEVSEIHYDKGYGFTLFTASDALTIKIGSGDFAEKIGRLAKIYQSLIAQRPTLQYIDLDYNDKIVVKKS